MRSFINRLHLSSKLVNSAVQYLS